MALLGMVWTNLMRNKLRTILTLAVGVHRAVPVRAAPRHHRHAHRVDRRSGSERRLVTRNKISLVFPLPLSQYEKIKAMPGVTRGDVVELVRRDRTPSSRATSMRSSRSTARPTSRSTRATSTSWRPRRRTARSVPPGVDPKLAAFFAERTACVVGEKIFLAHKWKLGQTIHLTGTIYPGSWPFIIRAVYRSKVKAFGDETMFFHWDYLYEKSEPPGAGRDLHVLARRPVAGRRDGQARRRDVRELGSRDPHRDRARVPAGFVSMWGNIPFVISVIGLAVAFSIFLVAAVTMMMAIRERTNEFAVLKTLGFEDGAIFAAWCCSRPRVLTLVGRARGLAAREVPARDERPAATGLPDHGRALGDGRVRASALAVAHGRWSAGILPAWQASRLKIVDALRKVG